MDDIDAIYIATWPSAHCENVITAATAHKHVLCEKPLATTLDECDRMIEVCRQNQVKLMVGYMMRFNPAHVSVRKLIADQRIGPALIVKADFFTSFQARWGGTFASTFRFDKSKAGGGLLIDMGIHVVDLLRYVTGCEVVSVHSFHGGPAYRMQVEDTGTITLQFNNGSYGVMALSGGIPFGRNGVEIYGERGAILTEGSIGRSTEGQRVRVLRGETWEEIPIEAKDPFAEELRYFEECLRTNREPEPDGNEAKSDLTVILAAYESMRRRCVVDISAGRLM
jgi:glucose-fructose oxidoreductase